MPNKVSTTTPPGSDKDPSETKVPLFFIFLCTFCMAALYSNILAYHVTVNLVHTFGNQSDDFYEVYDYREVDASRINVTLQFAKFLTIPQKESLITVLPIGTLVALFPITMLYNHIGFRRSFVVCAFLGLIPSLLIPVCLETAKTYMLVIVVRIFQGLALAAFVPYLAKLNVFVPFDHPATSTVVFAYGHVAVMMCFPLTAIMSLASSWQVAHYAWAGATFIIFAVFLCINYDDELKERGAALGGIANALCTYERSRSYRVDFRLPYLSIYQDIKVWAIFLAAFGHFTAVQLYVQWGPTFFDKVLNLPILPASLVLIVPSAANIVLSILTLAINRNLRNTQTNKIRVFNTLSSVVPGVLLMIIGLFDQNTQGKSITALFIIASSLLGPSSCGFFRMAQLRSKQFHLFMLANLFAVNCASKFLTSLFNVLIARHNEYSSWASVFVLHGSILIITNVIFCFFADNEAAPWTRDGYEDTSIKPNRGEPMPAMPL